MDETLPPLERPLLKLVKQNGGYSELNKLPEADVNQFKEAPAPMERPGFLKSVEMIASGAAQGSLEYTSRLMNMMGNISANATGSSSRGMFFESKSPKEESLVTKGYKTWEQKNEADAKKYHGAEVLQTVGSLPMELITTAPLSNPVFGAVSTVAKKAGEYAPRGLKKIAEYGTAGAGGALGIAGLEGTQFNSDKPNEPFGFDQAAESLKDPLSYILPAAGQKVGNWMGTSRELQQLKKILPDATAADLENPNIVKSVKQAFFSPITNLANQTKQMEGIGDAISKYIGELSGNIVMESGKAAKYSKDFKEVSGQQFNKALQSLKQGMDDMWLKPFRVAPIENPQDIKNIAIEAMDILKNSGIPTSQRSIQQINKGLQKDKFTVEDVKSVYSTIGDAAGDAYSLGNQTANSMGSELSALKNQMIDRVQAGLSPKDLKDFTAARTMSKQYYDTINESTKIKDALYSEINAKNLTKSIIGEAEALNKQNALGLTTPVGRNAIWATKLTDVLKKSGYEGADGINLKTFIDETRAASNLPELMGDTYKAIEGLDVVLKNIYQSNQAKPSKLLGAIGSLGAVGAVGGAAASVGAMPAMAGVATYAALAGISKYSPLKSTLGLMTQKLSDSGYKRLTDVIERGLVTGGYFLTDDGVLDKSDAPSSKKESK